MCERILEGWTREPGAFHWMCWNPTRQAYVALFPLLSPSLSICLYPLSQASCLSLHLISFFLSFFFLFCSLVTMWAQCEMCLFVSFGDIFPRQREKLEMGTCKAACKHTLKNTCKHTFGHTFTHALMRDVLVLKTPRDSEIDMKISGLEQNRNELLAVLHVVCTYVSQLYFVSAHLTRYPGNNTHMTWANAKDYHVVAMHAGKRRMIDSSQLCDTCSICI